MMKLISRLAQKPTDKTIRITRVVFALIVLATILLGWSVTRTEFGLPTWIMYGLFVFPAIGLIRGIFDPGIFRKKIWKWTVFGLGISMMFITLFAIEDIDIQTINSTLVSQSNTGTLNIANIGNTPKISTPFTVSTDNFFGLYGFILAIMGLVLNSKNITLKNERYGEIVKKIRV